MGAKLRATITRPDMSAVLSSLPTVSASLSSATTVTSGSDDPIDDLDAIIDDDDDLAMAFHDPLDDLFQDNQMLEVINPNLRLPGSQGGSKRSSPSSVGITFPSLPLTIHVHLHILVLRWKLMQCWPLELD